MSSPERGVRESAMAKNSRATEPIGLTEEQIDRLLVDKDLTIAAQADLITVLRQEVEVLRPAVAQAAQAAALAERALSEVAEWKTVARDALVTIDDYKRLLGEAHATAASAHDNWTVMARRVTDLERQAGEWETLARKILRDTLGLASDESLDRFKTFVASVAVN